MAAELADRFPQLAEVPQSVLRDYLLVRKSKNASPVSETIVDSWTREALESGISLTRMLEACCNYNWVGFNAGWYASRTGKTANGHSNGHPEPAWRAEQRQRTRTAAPGVATGQKPAEDFFIEAEVKRVTPH